MCRARDGDSIQSMFALHRYVAIRRPDAIQPAFDALLGAVDEVLPISGVEVLRAREIVLGKPGIPARDAIHVAVMEVHGISRILSFDRGFDGLPGIERDRKSVV